MAKNVIGTHCEAVNPNSVKFFCVNSDFEFGTYAICPTDKDRVFIPSDLVKCSKTSNAIEDIFVVGFAYCLLDFVYGFVAFFFIYASGFVSIAHIYCIFIRVNSIKKPIIV